MTCPYCGGATSLLPMVSSVSVLDYYECAACTRLSERPKNSSVGPRPLQTLPVSPAIQQPPPPAFVLRVKA